jgi:nucleoside-diphosphate-sugar epimerase
MGTYAITGGASTTGATIKNQLQSAGHRVLLVPCAGEGSHIPNRELITAGNYSGTVDLVEGLRELLAENRASVLLASSNSAPMPTNPEKAGSICGAMLSVDGGHDAMLRPDNF